MMNTHINALQNIRVVLVRPTHPGNIGAAARALANMGLTRLCLVLPRAFPHAKATARAAGAKHILETASVHINLGDALTGCTFVVATSARQRASAWPQLSPRAAAMQLVSHASVGEAALLFGPEHSGLSNCDLECAHRLVHVPVDAYFASLNLAAAVMIMVYEIRIAWLAHDAEDCGVPGDERSLPGADEQLSVAGQSQVQTHARLADAVQMESFHRHLEEVMRASGFLSNKPSTQLQRKLKLLFQRAHPTMEEINILRGMLRAMQKSMAHDLQPSRQSQPPRHPPS